MKTSKPLKAPFPYYGGKQSVADMVWERLGDVGQLRRTYSPAQLPFSCVDRIKVASKPSTTRIATSLTFGVLLLMIQHKWPSTLTVLLSKPTCTLVTTGWCKVKLRSSFENECESILITTT